MCRKYSANELFNVCQAMLNENITVVAKWFEHPALSYNKCKDPNVYISNLSVCSCCTIAVIVYISKLFTEALAPLVPEFLKWINITKQEYNEASDSDYYPGI